MSILWGVCFVFRGVCVVFRSEHLNSEPGGVRPLVRLRDPRKYCWVTASSLDGCYPARSGSGDVAAGDTMATACAVCPAVPTSSLVPTP